jgi:hypothetical protein
VNGRRWVDDGAPHVHAGLLSLIDGTIAAMPIHDWTRVTAGTSHAMHVAWLGELQGTLNDGVLPADYYAMAEQETGDVGPDVLALRSPTGGPAGKGADQEGGVAVASVRPRLAIHGSITQLRAPTFPSRRIVIRHAVGGDAVALIEIVSPGNKDSRASVEQFVNKAASAIRDGLNLQVIDLFPPRRSDPAGLHAAIWAELGGDPFQPPADRPLTLAAYAAGPPVECYVEPSAVAMPLADLPLFLTPERYVNVPLEQTYATVFRRLPWPVKALVDPAA